MVAPIIIGVIIIKHRTKLVPQLELMLLPMLEFMPLLLRLIVEFLFELLRLMVIIIELIKLVKHRLKLVLLLGLVPLVMPEHLLTLRPLPRLMLGRQRETRHLPFLLA
jgi:hypothetical protein